MFPFYKFKYERVIAMKNKTDRALLRTSYTVYEMKF
jgi:hypothetical protein